MKRSKVDNKSGQRLKLGVTGGIGSGKTTICRVFTVIGIPVFSADDEARLIQDIDIEVIQKINEVAGRDLYTSGKLDRPGLARIIFNNRDLLEKVNSLIHPKVFENYRKWESEQDAPYTVMEAAILFESGAYRLVDKILTVVTPMEERIERLIKGNKLTREQVLERVNNQIDDESRIRQSDYLVFNSENDMIIPAILGVHKEMLNLYKKAI
ncbi:MAG: dephospho-CoA kinase [Bacteroidota bacterium]|nr:dephospho-CoA kinase [Bacteroidota bacterium]